MERGALRVYLGAAPGVGKTFAMLDEARRRAERGTDVVVGYVETHGRPHTESALGDLEVLPRASLSHKGSVHTELDLEAVLTRAPEVVLVDELAHSNVPGSERAKRWQDVQVLLAAGIEVITTVNAQHLESLNDVVEAITGVRQRETVPDHVVRAAQQIELVDMSPQSLRRRMAHGNVYRPSQVDAALSRYFREGNLTALRELTLLWLAHRVEEGLERYRQQHGIDSVWATRDRIVVPVSGGPESATLMRRASRITSRRSGGRWMALHVTRRDGLSGVTPDELAALRRTTEDLGGTLHTVVGDDVCDDILDFARAESATQIVLGASRRGRASTLLRPGVGERVIAESGDIDVHIVTHDLAGRQSRARSARHRQQLSGARRATGYVFGVVAPWPPAVCSRRRARHRPCRSSRSSSCPSWWPLRSSAVCCRRSWPRCSAASCSTCSSPHPCTTRRSPRPRTLSRSSSSSSSGSRSPWWSTAPRDGRRRRPLPGARPMP